MKKALIELLVFVVIYYALTKDPDELRMEWWLKVSHTCQWIALAFGRAGLYASNRYYSVNR